VLGTLAAEEKGGPLLGSGDAPGKAGSICARGESAESLQELLTILPKSDGALLEAGPGRGKGISDVAEIEIWVGFEVGGEALCLSA
jgi:hypothetical protein